MKKIIGIHGVARSGKDTIGEFLHKYIHSSEITSFAKPIKRMLNVGLNIPDVWLHSNIKDQVIDGFDCTPRHMMQTLGTEWGRELIHPDIWVIALHELIKNTNKIYIIPDVRFQNEADYVRKHGTLIHVYGRGGIEGNHISEQGLKALDDDFVINNNGTIDDLRRAVQNLVIKF